MSHHMIKGTLATSCLLFFTLLFAACDLETSGNGKLDGFWHLESVDTLSGGFNDLSQKRIFWAFQKDLLELSDKDYVLSHCLMRFNRDGGALKLSDPYLYDRESGEGDHPLMDAAVLNPYGINAIETTFTVEKLSSSKMVLNDGTLRLYFTKF